MRALSDSSQIQLRQALLLKLRVLIPATLRGASGRKIAEGMLCSVRLLDQDRVHMRAIAAPTLPESYIAALDGFVVGPQGGTCGAAVNRREPVFVSDVLTDSILPTALLILLELHEERSQFRLYNKDCAKATLLYKRTLIKAGPRLSKGLSTKLFGSVGYSVL